VRFPITLQNGYEHTLTSPSAIAAASRANFCARPSHHTTCPFPSQETRHPAQYWNGKFLNITSMCFFSNHFLQITVSTNIPRTPLIPRMHAVCTRNIRTGQTVSTLSGERLMIPLPLHPLIDGPKRGGILVLRTGAPQSL
jgi:hypothetical protein